MSDNTDQTITTSLSPIADFNQLELTAVRDIMPLTDATYDVTTAEGMAQAKADMKLVTSFLTRLEAVRKAIKDQPFRLCQQIDSEAKRIAKPVEEQVKARLRQLIDAEEGRLAEIERKRVEAIRSKIAALCARPAWGASAAKIAEMLRAAEAMDVDATFAEFEDEAVVAKAEAMRDLRQMLETAQAIERQAAEAKTAIDQARVAGHAAITEPRLAPMTEAPVSVAGEPGEPNPNNLRSVIVALDAVINQLDVLLIECDDGQVSALRVARHHAGAARDAMTCDLTC